MNKQARMTDFQIIEQWGRAHGGTAKAEASLWKS